MRSAQKAHKKTFWLSVFTGFVTSRYPYLLSV